MSENEKTIETVEVPKKELDMFVKSSELRTTYFDPVVWAQMKGMSEAFIRSGALPKSDNAGTIIMKMQAGFEIGLPPIMAIRSFYFVKGVLGIENRALAYKLKTMGYKLKYEDGGEGDNQFVNVTASNKEGDSYSQKMTFKMAHDSGWTEVYDYDAKKMTLKPGWKPGANRLLMLGYKAISILVKRYIPEAFGPAADTVENLQDISDQLPEQEPAALEATANNEVQDGEVVAPAKKTTLSDYLAQKKTPPKKDEPAAPPKDAPAPPANTYASTPAPVADQALVNMRKRYFAVSSKMGVTGDKAKEVVKKHFDVRSFNDLTTDQLAEFVNRMEADQPEEAGK